jgi:hypothetical protein
MCAAMQPRAGGSGTPATLVLLVGCPAELVAACQKAGDQVAVTTQECNLGSARAAALASRPFVIVTIEDVYQKGARELDALVRELKASLLRIDGADLRDGSCCRHLALAITESAVGGDADGTPPVC